MPERKYKQATNAYIKRFINFTVKFGGEREYYADILKSRTLQFSNERQRDIEKKAEMKTVST
jgi:hypothetical protein